MRNMTSNTQHQVIDTFDHAKNKTTPLTVAPIEQQDDFETRKAWQKVANAIVAGDMDTTSYHKSIIENRQRAMRKEEKDEGREWERRFFSRTEKSPVVEKLAAQLGESLNEGQTNGIWLFDQEKAKTAKSPFHPDVKPPIYEEAGVPAAQ